LRFNSTPAGSGNQAQLATSIQVHSIQAPQTYHTSSIQLQWDMVASTIQALQWDMVTKYHPGIAMGYGRKYHPGIARKDRVCLSVPRSEAIVNGLTIDIGLDSQAALQEA
jgi:hypothetical protein